MFCNCSNLKYLDLSNFNTLKVQTIEKMFYNCKSLIYLNLGSFHLINSVKKDNSFFNISTFGQYCIKDSTILNYVSSKLTSDCSNACFQKNIKIDIINNICIKSCLNKKYEKNNVCLNECRLDSYPLFNGEKDNIMDIICSNSLPQGYYFDSNDNIYKKCYINCLDCYGPGNEINNNCIQCKINFIFLTDDNINKNNCYKKCDYYYYFESNEYYCTKYNKCPEKYNKVILEKNKCIDECKFDKIYQYEFNNTCFERCPFGTSYNEGNYTCLKKEEIEIQNEYLINVQSIFNKGFNTSNIDNGKDWIYMRGNIIYSITTTKNQRNNRNNTNMTTIDLRDCENELKLEYNISLNDNLYILKIDALINHMNKLEYEVYYPFSLDNFTKLNLSICANRKITISIPINIPLNEIQKYNQSSEMYNDICFSSTSESGTDKPLKDRQNDYIDNNMSICEEDCEFTEYDNINHKAICSCTIKLKFPLISEIRIDKKKLFDNFKDIKNIANFKLLKCFNLLFIKQNILRNSSNYILVILLFLSIIAIFIFICKDNIYINHIIKEIMNQKKSKNIRRTTLNDINKDKYKKNILNNGLTRNYNNKYFKSLLNMHRAMKRNQNIKNKRINNIYINSNSLLKNRKSIFNRNSTNMNINNSKINKKRSSSISITNFTKIKYKNTQLNLKGRIKNNYNDNEMNFFSYNEAKQFDKRTYFQYYISLLKTKHILIFSFFLTKDYNSQIIKIYILFFTFAINYFISSMFYSDSTMHKIYKDEGAFDFTYQLPKMAYSLIISALLKSILNNFGLYEENIISFKNHKNSYLIAEKVLYNIKYKIFVFFNITYILLIFLWFYLGCFCAVYKNTQLHLLKDVSLSFSMSFITPFFIYLIPGMFRIPSLKQKKKSSLLYNFSKLLQMF